MVIKLAGIILAFSASTILGLYKASEIKRRKHLLMDFKELLLRISTEMGYFKEPLPQIFQRLAGIDNKESSILLRECIASYTSENSDISLIWKQAAEDAYNSSPLTKEDLAVIQKCGDFLGQSDFNGQKDHFALTHAQLDRQISEAEDAIGTKGKMYGKMGVSIGLVIAIILF